jgi:hypothetical protein
MVKLKQWAPAIGGGVLFAASVIGLTFHIYTSTDSYVQCQSEMEKPGIITVLDGNVVGKIICKNTTRIPVEYRMIDAQLFVDNHIVNYEINGLAYGDVFEGGETKEADVIIGMEPAGLLQIGLKVITGDELTANIQGTITLAIFGIEFTVPLSKNISVHS